MDTDCTASYALALPTPSPPPSSPPPPSSSPPSPSIPRGPTFSFFRLYITANGGAWYAVDGATRVGAKTLAFSSPSGELNVSCSTTTQCSASSYDASQGRPHNAFLGYGVPANGQACSASFACMWTSYWTSSPGPPQWLQYRFDAPQELVAYHMLNLRVIPCLL